MSEQTAQEPTMEEILASIRRIISEDDAPSAQAAAPAPQPAAEEADEPLELTERIDADEEPAAAMFEPEPEPAPRAEPARAESRPVERSGDLDIFAAPAERPAPRAAAPAASFEDGDDGLLSETAARSAASAFGQLAQTVAMPADGQTLDGVVRELLRPLLKEWLDRNLPAVVEAQVQAEVERIARRSAR